jgi:dihydroneopterin aldolase
LQEADARALLPLRPDVLGFRGALCGGGQRGDALQRHRVDMMRALILQSEGMGRAADYALIAEEG